MELIDVLFLVAEIIGTVAFAVSGAMVAIDKRQDLFGVLFLGVTTALGGGTMRDMMLGIFPPQNITNTRLVALSLVTSLLIFVLVRIAGERYLRHRVVIERVNNMLDALGLSAFVVSGVQTTLQAGYTNFPLCIFLGLITGAGGGILRDVLSGQTPAVFCKHVYATAALVGATAFYFCLQIFALPAAVAILISMTTTFSIRLLASFLHWNLPKAIP